MKIFVDAVVGGALMEKSIDVTRTLLEEIELPTTITGHVREPPLDGESGKCNVDAVTLLASWVDALAQRLDSVGTSPLLGSSLGPPVGVYAVFQTCSV